MYNSINSQSIITNKTLDENRNKRNHNRTKTFNGITVANCLMFSKDISHVKLEQTWANTNKEKCC